MQGITAVLRARAACVTVPLVVAALVGLPACGGTTADQLTGPGAVKCAIALSSSSVDIPASGGAVTVGLTAERECAWTSRSDTAWMQVSPASGQGDAPLTLNVAANTQQAVRAATFTVNDVSFRVNQAAAAAPPAPCAFTLSPTSRTIDSDGGTRTVDVQTTAGCTWNAATSVSWITISAPSNGTGPGTVTYVVARNQSKNTRSGAVTAGGRTHTVTQAGR